MKKLLSMMMIGGLLFGFTACGGEDHAEEGTDAAAAVEGAIEEGTEAVEEHTEEATEMVEEATETVEETVEGTVEEATEAVEGAVEEEKKAVKTKEKSFVDAAKDAH
jgi:ABC-type nitrate/sulfonate/bicarbonate transport system substrate-binding protein